MNGYLCSPPWPPTSTRWDEIFGPINLQPLDAPSVKELGIACSLPPPQPEDGSPQSGVHIIWASLPATANSQAAPASQY
ncbi:hypothetical protein DSO57_1009915 [Entomophthora muscae]|uniref:Uncharacterized protein n=1 Tax=Entomophthora muscae TaxID=34485 RepID=A0ACC2SVU7_9FUNG|nr:hypothetical protein DSO57_1009915 [Entomophthora muscae]